MLFWKETLHVQIDVLVEPLGSVLPLIQVKPCANHVSDGSSDVCTVCSGCISRLFVGDIMKG